MLRLPGPVDDTPHDGHAHLFDAGVTVAPCRHLLAEVVLNVLRHLLEEGGRGAPASGTGGHLRRKVAQSEGLKNLLRDLHLLGAITVRSRGERYANRVADAFGEQN